MNVNITRIDKSLPLPTYETKGALGFDFLARNDMVAKAQEIVLIPSNVIIKVPEGYALFVIPRSSTPKKKQLLMPHSIGLIDSDYSGSSDEIFLQFYNFSNKNVDIKKGEKIAQGIFVKIAIAEFQEQENNKNASRGGFGSTD